MQSINIIKNFFWKFLDFPKFIFPNNYVRFADPESYYIDKLLSQIKVSKKERSVALDAGAGNQNKKPYLVSKGYEYESCDFEHVFDKNAISTLTHVCSVEQMTMPDCKYDLIISIQVLEHLKDPEKAISEMYRVLSPGGLIFLSTNFLYPEHGSPHDYFRFTKYGLIALFARNRFNLLAIESHGGFLAMCAQFFHEAPSYFRNYIIFGCVNPLKENKPKINRLPLLLIVIIPLFLFNLFFQALAFVLHFLDRFDKNQRYSLGYSVIAIK